MDWYEGHGLGQDGAHGRYGVSKQVVIVEHTRGDASAPYDYTMEILSTPVL